MRYDPNLARDNPYNSSRKYKPEGFWYDSFAKSGEIVWLVFAGDRLLAEVKNEQQCKNLLEYLCLKEFGVMEDMPN